MLQSDYLVRMFTALAVAIRESMERARGDMDPSGAAMLLEEAFSQATDVDGAMLLKLAPESMVSVLQISGSDPILMGYLSRTLLLESRYLKQANDFNLAELRHNQAHAIAQAYGFELDDEMIEPEALDEFFEHHQE